MLKCFNSSTVKIVKTCSSKSYSEKKEEELPAELKEKEPAPGEQ